MVNICSKPRERLHAHLLDAAGGGRLPPDSVPSGEALAIWFFLHRRDVFEAVFFQHDVSAVHSWRLAKAPAGLTLRGLPARADRLGAELRSFFRRNAGVGRFCVVEARRVADAVCFAARIADRIHLVEGFSDVGKPSLQRVRPALTVLFAYSHADGLVLMKSPVRAAERVSDLLRLFGQAVLLREVSETREAFDLKPLVRQFHPPPDAGDMESVRVKTLYLRYPQRYGRRRVKLETPAGDAPDAMEQMLRRHARDPEAGLSVSYAELQVRLRREGRVKTYTIRLWEDRCNLNHTPLGLRFRTCLRRWGLSHG
jgi:hypothetical protein